MFFKTLSNILRCLLYDKQSSSCRPIHKMSSICSRVTTTVVLCHTKPKVVNFAVNLRNPF